MAVTVLFVPEGAVVASNQSDISAVAEQPLPRAVFATRRVSLAALSALSIAPCSQHSDECFLLIYLCTCPRNWPEEPGNAAETQTNLFLLICIRYSRN